MKIYLDRNDPDYSPVKINVSLRPPISLENSTNETLKWLVNSGVIERVDETEPPPEWCARGFWVKNHMGVPV